MSRPSRCQSLAHSKILFTVFLGSLLCMGLANAQQFRWPEEPENLQVLGEDTKAAELRDVMRGFATALGVRCEHCHVGEGFNLANFDFASDDKPAKQKARLMLEMVESLNNSFLPQLADIESRRQPALQVECVTCHRGQPRPILLHDLLQQKISSDGVDAAIAEYRTLRDKNYGGFSYDFSAGVLTGLGERLGEAGDYNAAIRMIELEIEMNGESPSALYALGGIQAGGGMLEDARASYTRGLELAPNNWRQFFESAIEGLDGNPER